MAVQKFDPEKDKTNLKVSDTGIKPGLQSSQEPLYKRIPHRDDEGKLLSDLMMLIPGMRQSNPSDFGQRIDLLHAILGQFDEVVFADLNVPLNLLWVSVRSRNGVTNDLSEAIREQIPEARIVGHTTITNAENESPQHDRIESQKNKRIESGY